MDNVVLNVEDYVGKYVKLTSVKGNVVCGIIYRSKDFSDFTGLCLFAYPYVIAEKESEDKLDFIHVYSFKDSEVKDIEVIL